MSPALEAYNVASFAEAWIEISPGGGGAEPAEVASFAEAWIEIIFSPYLTSHCLRRFFRGSVD